MIFEVRLSEDEIMTKVYVALTTLRSSSTLFFHSSAVLSFSTIFCFFHPSLNSQISLFQQHNRQNV